MVPHLNELAAEFDPRRVMIVGVTDEPKSLVEPYIEKHDVRYPIAIESGATREYEVPGFPHAVVIGADGLVKWAGNPGAEQEVHKVLVEEAKKVLLPLPRGSSSIQKLIDKGDLGKAHAALVQALEADGLAEADREALLENKNVIEAKARAVSETIEPALRDGVTVVAIVACQRLTTEFAGVPGSESAQERLAEWSADAELKPEFNAARKFGEAEALERSGEFEKARKAYQSIAKLHAKTSAGPEAERRAAALEGKKTERPR